MDDKDSKIPLEEFHTSLMDKYGGVDRADLDVILEHFFGFSTTLKVTNIQYDLDGDGTDSGFERNYSSEIGKTRQDVLSELPSETEIIFPMSLIVDMITHPEDGGRRDREDWIQEEIEEETCWLVTGFEYEMQGMTYRFLQSPHSCVVFNATSKRQLKLDGPLGEIWKKRVRGEVFLPDEGGV